MELLDFRSDFINEVSERATSDSNFTHSAFVDVAVELLEEAGELADSEICYFRGTSGRKSIGVDAYAFDKADNSARFVIAEFTNSIDATMSQTEANAHFTRLRQFVEAALESQLSESLEESSPARFLTEDLVAKRDEVSRIRLYLICDAQLSQRVRDWPEGAIGDISVEYHIWDISRFFRMRSSLLGQDELVVNFESFSNGGLPCLRASESDAYSAFLCIVPGATLAEIYNKHGSRLLEGNVRSFLSTTGKVNRAIRKTIVENPAMFFAFNNGIAATATSVELSADGSRIKSARDLQIVNGGQTTASLAAALRSLKKISDAIFVPMKLSVVDAAVAEALIPDISRCANSQNKVSEADFFSNHPYHRRLEQISRRLWAPASDGAQFETHWFYERARGQYVNESLGMTSANGGKFKKANPRNQVISKTDLAKSESSWAELPHKVSRGAQSAFLDFADSISRYWEKNADEFDDDYFRSVVARTILFREAQVIVQAQEWYTGGFRANIVTYGIAKLSHDIARLGGDSLDFNSIWSQQRLTESCRKQIAVSAFAAFKIITKPPSNSANITQWCKRSECWAKVQDAPNTLLKSFSEELVSDRKSEHKSGNVGINSATQVAKSAQAEVVELGIDYWRDLLVWGMVKRLVNPSARALLSLAKGMSTSQLPTEKQSAKMLEIRKGLQDKGYPK